MAISIPCLGRSVFLTLKCPVYHVSLCFCVFYLGFYLDSCFCGGIECDKWVAVSPFRVVCSRRGIEWVL